MINQFDIDTSLGFFYFKIYIDFVQFLRTSYFLFTVYYACTLVLVLQA